MSGYWNPARITDLKAWLITERLPPEATFERLVELCELAEEGENVDTIKEENEELSDRIDELEKELDISEKKLDLVRDAIG